MTIDTSMNVLIVDDHKTMLRIVNNVLMQIGFKNVDQASDGEDALKKLAAGKYGLILSDWNMMPMTGLELLQYVRKDGTYGHQNTPFIMITAEARPENIKEAAAAGVDNYVIKPFDADTLKLKIGNAIKKRA